MIVRRAGPERGVRGIGLAQRIRFVNLQKCVERTFHEADPVQAGLSDFARGHFAAREPTGKF